MRLDDITWEMFDQAGIDTESVYKISSGPYYVVYSVDEQTQIAISPVDDGWSVEIFCWVEDGYETIGATKLHTPVQALDLAATILSGAAFQKL